VQATALALALSLALGPAAPAEAPAPADDPAAEDADDATRETEAEDEPEHEGEDEAEPEPEPEPGGEAEPEPEVEPEPEPEVEPEPEPEPEPPPPGEDPGFLAHSSTQGQLPAPTKRDRLGCDGSKPCRRMTIAGIVVGSLGLVGVGTGIGLLLNDDQVIPESPIHVTSTHPPGLVTLTISAGVTLTSVLMLIAAHRGYKERGLSQARVRVVPGGLRF
jgi:hypothetical protein